MEIKRLALIGPPACGKGTQADHLIEKFNLKHVSSGAILREEVKKQSDFGLMIKPYMDRGEIGPQELITEIVMSFLSKIEDRKFLLDGFPRTLYQAKELSKNNEIDVAISIEVEDASVIERITGRQTCSTCNRIFHKSFNPSKIENICDSCNGPLITREDDTIETVKTRLNVFHSQTAEVIDYYKTKGLLRSVNGDQSPDLVTKEIKSILHID